MIRILIREIGSCRESQRESKAEERGRGGTRSDWVAERGSGRLSGWKGLVPGCTGDRKGEGVRQALGGGGEFG